MDFDKAGNILKVFCVACKPGFKATRNGVNKWIYGTTVAGGAAEDHGSSILTCDAITNCESSTMVNGCSKCKYSSIYVNSDTRTSFTVYYAYPDYFYNECRATNTDNCFIASTTIISTGIDIYECAVCKPGYFLNYDKICEELIIHNCDPSVGK